MTRYGRILPQRRKPGQLLYFGGAVHEVLTDGHTTQERVDLVPDSPKGWWKPLFAKDKGGERTMRRRYDGVVRRKLRARLRRWRVRPSRPRRRWIQHALRFHKKGSLHRMLGVPLKRKIPTATLLRAVRDPRSSKLLRQRSHLALTLRHYRGPR